MSLIQSIDYAAIAPPLITALTGLAVLVLDLFVPAERKRALAWLAAAGLLGALGSLLPLRGSPRGTFCLPGADAVRQCSYVVNDLTLVFQLLALAGALVAVLMSANTVAEQRLPAGEFWFLLLSSAAGAAAIAAARDLMTLVVALEVVSLPAFALVAMRRYEGRGSEAAVKFFLVSVVSTAVMLYGISLVYGLTGSVQLSRVSAVLADTKIAAGESRVVAVGVVLALVGLAFKVAAVPFHGWLPDTYAGAPVPVAAYLSVVSKAAGFVGFILVVSIGFAPYSDIWGPVVAVLAALTMTVGNLVALRQRHAVRLLAWSTIAHSGYVLVPLGVAVAAEPGGTGSSIGEALSASVAYLLVYAVMNLGAFAVVVVVGRQRPANRLVDYRGLVRTEPVTALVLAFFLACLAGLPPGLVGLFAKVVVFKAAVSGGLGWLAVVMAVNTVIALYYYAVWAGLLFAAPDPAAPPPSYKIPPELGLAVGTTLGVAVVLSLLPQIVLNVLVNLPGLIG
jgi:NADH-quinone oxidoreductase subunit N